LFSEYKIDSPGNNPKLMTISSDKVEITDIPWNDKLYPNWIVTDMRFPNELEAIKNREGITIRVNRDIRCKDGLADIVGRMKEEQHPSETALDDATFDYTIDNNGTIEELIEKVKEILIKKKII
jgi:hypothetical protein